jgi:hypothetical protein
VIRVGTGCDAPLDNEIFLDPTALRFLLGAPRNELLEVSAGDCELDCAMLGDEDAEAVSAASVLLFDLGIRAAGPVVVLIRGSEGASTGECGLERRFAHRDFGSESPSTRRSHPGVDALLRAGRAGL